MIRVVLGSGISSGKDRKDIGFGEDFVIMYVKNHFFLGYKTNMRSVIENLENMERSIEEIKIACNPISQNNYILGYISFQVYTFFSLNIVHVH